MDVSFHFGCMSCTEEDVVEPLVQEEVEPASRRSVTIASHQMSEAFDTIDVDKDGFLCVDEFVAACASLGMIDESAARRLFSAVDFKNEGKLGRAAFQRAVFRRRIFSSIVSDLTLKDFVVSSDYDYSCSTAAHYRHPIYRQRSSSKGDQKQKEYSDELHGKLVGSLVDIRKRLDFSYHSNYSEERQIWQDHLAHSIAYTQEPVEAPWLIFTCGAMGAGKGYVMSWMSNHDIFPLERVAHVDPDAVKQHMPEWQAYLQRDRDNGTKVAGSMCHQESGLIQELATEIALRAGGNVWVDGSLQDHQWYKNFVFADVRKRFQHYKIALFYVHCELDTLKERARRRGVETGRFIPEEVLVGSFHKTAKSIEVLSPLADFVVLIDNEHRTPVLERCIDNSKAFSAVRNRFSSKAPQQFPLHLPALHISPIDLFHLDRSGASARLQLSTEATAPPPENVKRSLLVAGDSDDNFLPKFSHPRPLTRVPVQDVMSWAQESDEHLDANGDEKAVQQHVARKDWAQELQLKHLVFSSASKLTLDATSRRLAHIPDNAAMFLMCHGGEAEDGSSITVEQAKAAGVSMHDKRSLLVLFGAFFYIDEKHNIVGVNLLLPGIYRCALLAPNSHDAGADAADDSSGASYVGSLQFGVPRSVSTPLTAALDRDGRWITDYHARSESHDGSRRKLKYAWLFPGEHPHGPHGGFAYDLNSGDAQALQACSSGGGVAPTGAGGRHLVFFGIVEV